MRCDKNTEIRIFINLSKTRLYTDLYPLFKVKFSVTTSNHNTVTTKEESALFDTLMSYDATILKTKTTKSAVQTKITESKVKTQHRGEQQTRL